MLSVRRFVLPPYEASRYDVKTIGSDGVPLAINVPSTRKYKPAAIFMITPGWITNVVPLATTIEETSSIKKYVFEVIPAGKTVLSVSRKPSSPRFALRPNALLYLFPTIVFPLYVLFTRPINVIGKLFP